MISRIHHFEGNTWQKKKEIFQPDYPWHYVKSLKHNLNHRHRSVSHFTKLDHQVPQAHLRKRLTSSYEALRGCRIWKTLLVCQEVFANLSFQRCWVTLLKSTTATPKSSTNERSIYMENVSDRTYERCI